VVYDDWRARSPLETGSARHLLQAPSTPTSSACSTRCSGTTSLASASFKCILGALACALLRAAGSRLFCRTIGVFSGYCSRSTRRHSSPTGSSRSPSLEFFFVCLFPRHIVAAANRAPRSPAAWLLCGVVLGNAHSHARERARAGAVAVAFIALQPERRGWRRGRRSARAGCVDVLPVAFEHDGRWRFHVTTAAAGRTSTWAQPTRRHVPSAALAAAATRTTSGSTPRSSRARRRS